ncbi:MAG TPA: hypothetical protein DEA46_02390, partial [Candidatus Moranbacteria bacterium]|nr:hypothetical protein [Candidatus Moranbacteria bacterium]
AKFTDKTTAEVSLSWIVSSGGGSIVGTTYTAPNNVATVKLMGTFNALDGSARSVYFTLTIYGNEIYGNRGMVTPEGAKFNLTNGITVEIPPNSAEETFEVNFEIDRSYGNFKVLQGQIIFSCNFMKKISDIRLTRSAKSGTEGMDYTIACIMPDINEVMWQDAIMRDSQAVFLISSTFMPGNGLPAPGHSPSWLTTGYKKIIGKTSFLFYFNDEIAQEQFKKEIISSNKSEISPIKWPFYLQYKNTCWAATWLMLMKGYSNNLSNEFDSIYKIVKEVKKRNNIGIDIEGNLIHAGIDSDTGGFSNKADLLWSLERARVVQLTQEYNKITLNAYYCDNIDALINFAVEMLSQKIPIKVDGFGHSSLIIGFEAPIGSYEYNNSKKKYDYLIDKMFFWVNDPFLCIRKKRKISVSDFIKVMNQGITQKELCYICYASDKKNFAAQTLQTIHLPGEGKIEFVAENERTISKTNISFLDSEIVRVIPGDAGLSKIADIQMFKIPIFSNDVQKDVQVKSSIYNHAMLMTSEICTRINSTGVCKTFSTSENLSTTDECLIVLNSEELITKFNNKIKELNITTEQEYTLLVELIDVNTTTALDTFDVCFNYKPPKELTITSAPKHDFIGNNVQFQAKYGDTNVTNAVVWKVMKPDANVITDGQGVFAGGFLKTTGEISAITEYNILASYTDYTDPNLHVTFTQEVKLKLLPGIIPSKRTFISNVAQSFQLALGTKIMGDRATCIEWSGDSINSSGVYSFVAHENRKDQITARLAKGTMLPTGETLETDLFARATMRVYDMHLDPRTKMIDIKEKYPFDLKWNAGPNNMVYFTNQAEWSCSNGTIEITNDRAVYTPSKPGVDIITAKIAEGTFIRENSNDVISGNDLEFTAEVTVVEIKVLEQTPLVSRIEPVDAEGSPMSNYRIEKEFSVSVDSVTLGATSCLGASVFFSST